MVFLDISLVIGKILLNSKILFAILSQFTVTSFLIKLPNKYKKEFLILNLSLLCIVFISTLYITYLIINNRKINNLIGHHYILLLIFCIILSYSSTYYALYNYDDKAFNWEIKDKKDLKDCDNYTDMVKTLFDMVYFTITTSYFGGLGDITPRTRLARSIVISQFITVIAVLFIIFSKI
jgi:hypothetical protein